MTAARWAALVVGLLGVFLISVAAGGFVARQLRPQLSAPPVAVASPTLQPALTPAAASEPATGQPPAAPPPSAGLETAAPATIAPATAAASQTPATTEPTPPATDQPPTEQPPTAGPASAEPTVVPPSAIPTGALDPPTAGEFADDLSAAIRDGDNVYLNARLHPATIERYSARSCRQHVKLVISGSEITWEVLASSGPAPWDYTTDEVTTTINDAWVVNVRQPGADPELRDVHFASFEGTWRWFTDCGVPS